MKINVDRLCQLAGVERDSSEVLSEASNRSYHDGDNSDEVEFRYGGAGQLAEGDDPAEDESDSVKMLRKFIEDAKSKPASETNQVVLDAAKAALGILNDPPPHVAGITIRDWTRFMASSSKAANNPAVIDLDAAHLTLGTAAAKVKILKGINLQIGAGETVGVLGPSGAGKTSLLMILAGLETLGSGRITLDGTDITGLDEDRLAALRRDLVGIVFQAFRLIPSLTALQNVTIPLELAGRDNAADLAAAALHSVGLEHRLSHLPDQMSGGEQQRVAIARAMVAKPRILLADEPTGNELNPSLA